MVIAEKLIAEIEKYPILYDIYHDQYNHKGAKQNAWYAVGKTLIAGWDHMTSEEQDVEVKILRNKWRNVRDCFVKEYKLQLKFSSVRRRRRKYAYYDQLMFLMPSTQAKLQESEITSVECRPDNNDILMSEVTDESSLPSALSADEKDFLYVQQNTITVGKEKLSYPVDPLCDASTSYDNETQEVQSSSNNNLQAKGLSGFDDMDYDKMFLLSLLPSFRQLPENMKLQIRIQFQQILVFALNPNSSSSNNSNNNNTNNNSTTTNK